MPNHKRRWFDAASRGLCGLAVGVGLLAVGVGFVVLLAGSLLAWYFVDRGTKAVPGRLGDFTRIALGADSGPYPMIQRFPFGFGPEGVEIAVRQGLQSAREQDPRPEIRNAVLQEVQCREISVPAGLDSDQRFSCTVAWQGSGITPAALLDIRNGQLVPVEATGSSQGSTSASGPPPCSPAAKSEITRMLALAEAAGAANRKLAAAADAPLAESAFFDDLFGALRIARIENARSVDRLLQFEPRTDPGRQLKRVLVNGLRGAQLASTQFLGNARTTEEWILASSWAKAFDAWRAAINRERDRFANLDQTPLCS